MFVHRVNDEIVRLRVGGRVVRVVDGVADPIDLALAQLQLDCRRDLIDISNRVRRELGLPRCWSIMGSYR